MATVDLMDVAAVTPPGQPWKLGQHIKLLSPAVRVSNVAPAGGRIVSVVHDYPREAASFELAPQLLEGWGCARLG